MKSEEDKRKEDEATKFFPMLKDTLTKHHLVLAAVFLGGDGPVFMTPPNQLELS
jgi:hypothetical protein